MDKVLSQQDIDALFAQREQPKALAGEGTPEQYNFNAAGSLSAAQMKAVTTINEQFARNLMHTGGAWLRTPFEVSVASCEQMAYAEYLERVSDPAYLCSLRLEPLGLVGALELDLILAAPIVDLLLGGTGKADDARQLTDIEELILMSVTQIFVKELNAAWFGVGLQFMLERREAPAQIARMMALGEKTVCICFEIRMPDVRGLLNVCLPAMVVNTMLRRSDAVEERPRRRSAESQARVRELVGAVCVGATLQFPPVRLHARELSTLRPGSLLRLPVPRHAVAELRVGGIALGAARPVKVGDHRGACMAELGGGVPA